MSKLLIFTIIVGFLFTFCLGVSVGIFLLNSHNINESSENSEIIFNKSNTTDYLLCKNLSINETAYCLKNFINQYFDYHITKETNRTIEDVLLNGGDCYDYAMMVIKMSKELNVSSNYMRYDGLEDENGEKLYSGHRWATIWNNSTKCKIDMTNRRESIKCQTR